MYQGRYLVYSLGNFCFGGNTNPDDKDCLIFQQTFTVTGDEVAKNDDVDLSPPRFPRRPTATPTSRYWPKGMRRPASTRRCKKPPTALRLPPKVSINLSGREKAEGRRAQTAFYGRVRRELPTFRYAIERTARGTPPPSRGY